MNPAIIKRLCTLAIITISVFLNGCAIKTRIPANRFETPEARGEQWHGSVYGSIQGATEITLVPDYTRQPPRTNSPEIDRGYMIRPGVDLGVVERLDVSIKTPLEAPWTISAKYQFLGETEASAGEQNFSLAASMALGYNSDEAKDKDLISGVESEHETEVTSFDAAVIAGYRFHEKAMVYGGPFFTAYSADGEITQPVSSGAKHRFEGSGRQYGVNVGIRFHFGRFLLMLEEAYVNASYEAHKKVGFYTGVLAGFRW